MGLKDWLKGLGHTVVGGLSHIPGLGDFVNPLDACFKTDAQKAKENDAAWVHQLALPVSAFFGVMSGVYALQRIETLGPTPALLTGPIIAGAIYLLIDGAACGVEGKNIAVCVLGDAMNWGDSISKSLVGFDPHFATKFVGEIESGALSAVFGKACAN
jgi:hypothetical protein